MSHRFSTASRGLVVVVFEGEISPEEETQALLDFAALPDPDPTARVLVDRRAASVTVEGAHVRPHLDLVRTTLERRDDRPRMAIVAPSDANFGMNRMLLLTGGDSLPHDARVFRTLEEACQWLEIDEADVRWPETGAGERT